MSANPGGQLDAADLETRLQAVESLRGLERAGTPVTRIGPALPSYDHIHTTASYGKVAPGVFSAAHMVWAAHEARAYSAIMVEHESTAHFEEARRAVEIVNRGAPEPLRLILAVEFKAPLAITNPDAQAFSAKIGEAWGQGEAAWVVGMGATPGAALTRLVEQFQAAKQTRASQQLERLNRHFDLHPPLLLTPLLTPEGNITDRSLSLAIAQAKYPEAEDATQARHGSAIRKLLNPGQPGYAPYPAGLPSYQELIGQLLDLGMTPTFTAQLRGETLERFLPLLQSWGISGIDVAGIEPDEPRAEQHIQHFLALARREGLAFFGGSDYRGTGTGWKTRAGWMDDPLIRATVDKCLSR